MKEVKTNMSILERELNECYAVTGKQFPSEYMFFIRRAMVSFSVKAVYEDRSKRRKMMVDTLKHLPKIFYIGYLYFLRLKLRKWFFDMAVKQAHIEAAIQNRKIWVVQSTDLTFKLISSKDFRNAKTLKVFKKELTFKDMEETASCTVFPPRKA